MLAASRRPSHRVTTCIMSFNAPRKANITPGDLLLDIALFLEARLDVLNFCLTVRPVL
jgi:hypothetical protein